MNADAKSKKCYIYTRVSTAMQTDGYSLDAQERRMQDYAAYNNLQIVGKYSDEGRSGKSIEGRPEFLRMMEDIESHKDNVSYVLVFKLSRFGRNAKDVLVNLETMQLNDVNLICVEDGIDSSKDAGKLIISVLASVAEIERENIAAQTFAGRQERPQKVYGTVAKPLMVTTLSKAAASSKLTKMKLKLSKKYLINLSMKTLPLTKYQSI